MSSNLCACRRRPIHSSPSPSTTSLDATLTFLELLEYPAAPKRWTERLPQHQPETHPSSRQCWTALLLSSSVGSTSHYPTRKCSSPCSQRRAMARDAPPGPNRPETQLAIPTGKPDRPGPPPSSSGLASPRDSVLDRLFRPGLALMEGLLICAP